MSEAVHHFESHAGEYATHADGRPEFEERFKLWSSAIDRIAPQGGAGMTAIDLGCGPGHLTHALAMRGFHTIAIDGSKSMLARTRERLKLSEIDQTELRQNMLPLPTDVVEELTGQADVILMSSVIEYVERDTEVLRQCASLLREGGHLLISFPNRQSLYWRVQRRLRRTPLFAGSASRHQCRQYDPRSVWEMAQAADLQVQRITFFALPFQRYTEGMLPSRRPRLATLFLADLKRPARSSDPESSTLR